MSNLNEITIRAITDAAGCHRATFCAHFTDIYHLLSFIEDRLIEQITTRQQEALRYFHLVSPDVDWDWFDSFINASIGFYSRNAAYLSVFMQPRHCSAFSEKLKKSIEVCSH